MATAGDVARRAFTRILVESAEDTTLDPSDYADALSTLNDYMAEREANGMRLGFTPVTSVGDEVTVPPEALFGVINNLAIRLAPEYGGLVSPDLREDAREGLRTMRNLARKPGKTQLPQTLPVGSGNDSTYSNDHQFFKLVAQAVMTITANETATDCPAALTYYKAQGHWEIGQHQYLMPDISGRIRNSFTDKVRVNLKAVLALKGTASFTAAVAIYKNGREGVASGTVAVTATTPAEVTITGNFDMQPEDYIEVWVSDVVGTEDVILVDGRVELNRTSEVS